MNKLFQILLMTFAGFFLTACVTTSERQQQANDQVIAQQVKAMSKVEKRKFCSQLKSNHAKYRKKIIAIIWANLKRQKNNKMSYKQLNKVWLSLIHQNDSDQKLGKEFSFYKNNMLLNLRYGLASQCTWMNQKAI